ncbi:MAG: phosphatidylserine/phosphatidylglycerophosphate/cardiolipin synthase family protein [Candidatus Ozemobacteraceae bacterium]
MNRSLARRLLLVFMLVAIPLLLAAAEYEKFPVNAELQKVFRDIPGGAVGRVRLINSGEEAWYARWSLLQSAHVSIDSTYFILQDDIFGLSFLGMLKKKADEGVKIRLMVDARMIHQYFRMLGIDEFQDLLQNPNVQIRFYNGIPGSVGQFFKTGDLKFLSASNHDKILIADGKISITGGRNIGADYFVQPGESAIAYYDSDVVLDGEGLAKDLLKAFEDEWDILTNKIVKPDLINLVDQRWKLETARRAMEAYIDGGRTLDSTAASLPEKYRSQIAKFSEELKVFEKLSSFAGFQMWRGERARPVKIIDKVSIYGFKDQIGFNLSRFIEAARSEIVFQNPYIILSEEARDLLRKASARGVRIILHTNGPKSIDVPEALAFFCKEWAELMRDIPTLKIYMAPDSMHQLHSKAVVFDGQIALVGTYNLDPLSMVINSEEMAVIENPEFATMVRLRILHMTDECVECVIKREADGSITRVRGPEQDVTEAVLRKMKLLVKLNWLRPFL